MSDSGEIEVEAVSGFKVLPKEVTDEIGTIKLLYVVPAGQMQGAHRADFAQQQVDLR